MTKRQRNYQEEYQRRVERGKKRGLSRSQARGHPGIKEKHVAPKRRKTLSAMRLNVAAKTMSKGGSLSAGAREAGSTKEQLLHRLRDSKAVVKKNGKWILRKNRQTGWMLYSDGERYDRIWVADRKQAVLLGKYHNALKKGLREGDDTYLLPFRGKTVKDVDGRVYPLETDLSKIYEKFPHYSDLEIYDAVR